ncbi:S8 family serine peptidase [Bacillus sp. SD075]|uniref:S8 family serine peptidase n=1 Tax=Bacillus sp. SD075 TaxID=2781732 RepID=UPI001A956400|nr:S8 family serine peptidase [Bacillus sp. SD075]MBO1000842.1 S8 family serine peptidase [Bacillus sp. SD075]
MKNQKKTFLIVSASFLGLFLLSILFYDFLVKDSIVYSNVKIAILDSGITEDELIHKKYNTFTNTEETNDLFNHGTKIYNIIRNVAPENQKVQYYDIQVLNNKGLGSIENVCNGIDKAIEFNVDIISMSLGFNNDSEILHNCVNRAVDENIIVVAASGDTLSTDTDYPAKYEEILSIAAADSDNNLFSFSSTGKIDFIAPGVDIKTLDNKGNEVKESGSSIAAAYFVGELMSHFTEGELKKNDLKFEIIENNGRNFKRLIYNE